MLTKDIILFASKATGRTGLLLMKHYPAIALGCGILGIGVGTVLACKATLSLEEKLEKNKEYINDIKEYKEKIDSGELVDEAYTDKRHSKDLTKAYAQAAGEIATLYAVPAAIGILSLGLVITSHKVLSNRNVALMAAYKLVDEGFKTYRKRVRDEFGEEKEHMIRHGIISETYIDEQMASAESKGIKTRPLHDPNGVSIYARFFDEYSTQWSKEPEYNMLFLNAQQTYHNDLLRARGHVFLNEVYDALGIERSKAGAIVGWVLDKNNSDNFVSFGIYDLNKQRQQRNFVNGNEPSILLDFNVDGVIYDKI